jgi:hypothetical protein
MGINFCKKGGAVMDVDRGDACIRMSRKAWQIRAKLQEWSKHSITLEQFLVRQQKKKSVVVFSKR